jgi:hypothetical protein
MQPLKTITDRGAVIAWSPLLALPGVLAVGTKEGGGGGFEEYGGDLTLYAVDLSSGSQQCQVLGRCVLGWTALHAGAPLRARTQRVLP